MIRVGYDSWKHNLPESTEPVRCRTTSCTTCDPFWPHRRTGRPSFIEIGRSRIANSRNWQRVSPALLQSSGLAPGDRVVLFTENKLPFLVAHLGVVFAGGVPLPLNPRFTREEMRYFLSDSECRVVIAGEEQHGLVESLASELAFRPPVILDSAVWDPPAAPFRDSSPNSDHPCLMLYSSGTTGWPKGVVHTHANVGSCPGRAQGLLADVGR